MPPRSSEKAEGPRHGPITLLLIALLAVSSGCAGRTRLTADERSAINAGELQVRGAEPGAAGQRIFAGLRDDPAIRSLVEALGEPDVLRVDRAGPDHLPGRGAPERHGARSGDPEVRIHLLYQRDPERGAITLSPGDAGSWEVEPTGLASPEAVTAREQAALEAVEESTRPPQPTPRPPPPPTRAPTEAPEPVADPEPEEVPSEPPPPPVPSTEQAEECPIEVWREDCVAFCAGGAQWSWCGAE